MNTATVGGLILAWVALIASLLMGGGHQETFTDLPALILILGGSFCITIVAVPFEVMKGLLNVTRLEQRPHVGEHYFLTLAKDLHQRPELSIRRSVWSLRWLLMYADTIAILVAFFVMLYSISLLD